MSDIKEQLYQLNKISKKSVSIYHKFALSIGISDSSLGVLCALAEAKAPCSQYDLCNEWSIPKQTINTTVISLKNKGLITLVHVPRARNKKSIALTDTGEKFIRNTIDILLKAELEALEELTTEERALYVRLNQKYNQSLIEKLDDFQEKLQLDNSSTKI